MEATEGDNTISYLHKVLVHLKENSQKLSADLAQIRNEKIKEAQDIEIQLVLKQGFVEIPTSGELSDFENAVMLSRNDVESINLVILVRNILDYFRAFNFNNSIILGSWKSEIKSDEGHHEFQTRNSSHGMGAHQNEDANR